jgi:hypothetical protein
MTTTLLQPEPRLSDPTRSVASTRLAGAGGLLFVGVVILQNIVRGATAPELDATAAELVEHFNDSRAVEWSLVCTFVVSGIGLTLFLGGLWHRIVDAAPRARAWAQSGFLGVTGIFSLFTALVACEVALMVAARQDAHALSTMPVLWTLHNAIFAMLGFAVAAALFCLGRGAVIAGLVPSAFRIVAPVGSLLLAIGVLLGPATAEEMSGASAVGLVGFLGWLAFVAVAGTRMLRDAPVSSR